tara:strand:+ start:506 stop:805 length:300 start_codon:yes stop_codon:yes gene_type:complete
MIAEDVRDTINGMITHGVEGEGIASDSQYEVRFVLIDKTKPKHYRDPVWLRDNYLSGRTMADIAQEFGITPAAVNQWLNKHNIPTRSRGHKERDLGDSN